MMNIYGIIMLLMSYVVVDVVIVVDVVESLMSYVVVDVVIVVVVVKSLMLYVVVESMHTHIKLGAHALLNGNHSYHFDLRAYALHVDLGVDAPRVDFRS